MEVAVIGGGVAGLVSARHVAAPDSGMRLTLFERGDELGGTWIYEPTTHTDRHGLPTHSSMYKSLRSNLPKEVMVFPDFPHKQQKPSYLTRTEVLQYLNDYADHFALREYVKFQHFVKMIKPKGAKWRLTVVDLNKNKEYEQIFDAVIICNGHYSTPKYPNVKGIENFAGSQVHSHDYREPDPFREKNVLIIGAGPSGLDITTELSKIAKQVILSHHTDYATKVGLPETVIFKPDVDCVSKDGSVVFNDGSTADVDVIFYCTGYLYTYPFLSEDCGVSVENNYIAPLYKQIININNPSMGFIALPKQCPLFYIADLQVRFFLQTLKHPQGLPSKEEMLLSLDNEILSKKEQGVRQSDYHSLGVDNWNYVKELSELGNTTPVPDVLLKIYFHGIHQIFSDFKNFRNTYYEIINEENFTFTDHHEIQQQHLEKITSNLNLVA